MTKQWIRISVAVMTTLLGLAVLWQFRTVVVYVMVSVALAATLRPLVKRLIGRSAWERTAWVLAYVFISLIFFYLIFLVARGALLEIQQLATTISTQDEWRLPTWLQGSLFQEVLVSQLLPPSRLFQVATYGQAQSILPAILGFTQSLAGSLSSVFVIVVLSLYWIVSKSHFERLWLSLLPSNQRKQARDIWQTIEPDLGAYIRSQALLNMLSGLLLGLGYWVIGSPYPILLALIGAFVTAIPFVGVALAVLIPLLVGALTGIQGTPIIVTYTLLVMITLGVWVKPRLFYRRWDNPLLTLALLVAMSDAFGLAGVIVAPPLSAILQIFWSLLVVPREAGEAEQHMPDFKKRQTEVWASIQAMPEPPPPQITNTMERLSRLIERAEPILREASKDEPVNIRLPGPPPSTEG
jgi:predicted PurR-regulated permease PerM